MIHDVIREFPFLGSLFYGHWEDFELSAVLFLIIYLGALAVMLATCICGLVGYVLQSVALARIAKQQGAWRNIRIMAWLPFCRYFSVGKLAERCDVMQNCEKRRLWGRILLISCCVLIPIVIVALIVAALSLPGTQLFALLIESGGDVIGDSDSKLVNALILMVYVLFVLIALPIILFTLISYELFAFVLVALPIAGIVCLLFGVAILAIIRTLGGVCYLKVLREYFESRTALILTVIGQVTGLMPVVLLVASLKKTGN